MGMCHSLRSRLIGPQSAITYTGRTGGSAGVDGETGQMDYTTDPQLRDRLRVEEKARIKAENKRSRNIDKSLKAEKREYKQTHRLLLLGVSHSACAAGVHKYGTCQAGCLLLPASGLVPVHLFGEAGTQSQAGRQWEGRLALQTDGLLLGRNAFLWTSPAGPHSKAPHGPRGPLGPLGAHLSIPRARKVITALRKLQPPGQTTGHSSISGG
ncbi:hypothetical protein SKAU_G00167050 [Synaphobranchus kaupii]|uniref:Uncharacterized protein n=1 Tax=Synaphobranchus kaupii TaxID=118154 RepID=A0A9Q1J0C0_SYNKA|nr:hypothetical protein SKAU_G00167050 [Synaphobranchus kaupii]